MPFAGENAHVGSAEGGVTQGVADGVDGAVDVAEEVEEVPQTLRNESGFYEGERLDEHQNIVRCPRNDERKENR